MQSADSIQIQPEASAPPDRVRLSVPRWIAFPWKFLVGVVLIQSLVGSFIVLGWLWRVSQRFVLKAWWKRNRALSWKDFLAGIPFAAGHQTWPNWIVAQDFDWAALKLRSLHKAFLGSLWLNLKTGVQALFNTSVLLAPASALWIFSWYDGWNNSFNKGYEQAAVGPATGFAGVFLFIAAMFYVPMAQMRHAATGNWRAFYQFHLVWKLIRRRWLECLGLAMLISTLSLPIMALKTAPGMFTAMSKAPAGQTENGFQKLIANSNEDLTPQQALRKLKSYYFFGGFYLLPALVLFRYVAARIYAGAILDLVQSGAIPEDALHEKEWQALHRLNLLVTRPPLKRSRFVQVLSWVTTKAGAATVGFAIFLVYFTLVAQIYIGEFLHKNDHGQGWWNQPLVQLPFFDYTPDRLKEEARK